MLFLLDLKYFLLVLFRRWNESVGLKQFYYLMLQCLKIFGEEIFEHCRREE